MSAGALWLLSEQTLPITVFQHTDTKGFICLMSSEWVNLLVVLDTSDLEHYNMHRKSAHLISYNINKCAVKYDPSICPISHTSGVKYAQGCLSCMWFKICSLNTLCLLYMWCNVCSLNSLCLLNMLFTQWFLSLIHVV